MNFASDLILENDDLRLEPLSKHHHRHFLPICLAHPQLLQYSPSPFGTSEKLEEYIDAALEARKKGQRYPFAIYHKTENRFIGSTSYGNPSFYDARIEIGWTWLDKSAQGTGLNAICKKLLLNYAFTELSLQRVEFKTDRRNLQSRKAMEKLGAQFEGILRSHTLMPDGSRRDTAYYSILLDEWQG